MANTITGRYIRQVERQIDTTSVTVTTAWQPALAFPLTSMKPFRAGSIVKLYYYVPCRGDQGAGNWAGIYLEPQISYNGGSTWTSLGGSGYAVVMSTCPNNIGSYSNTILIDPQQSTEFGVQFKIYARCYQTVAGGLNSINSNTGVNDGGFRYQDITNIPLAANGQQHYAHVIVEELALL